MKGAAGYKGVLVGMERKTEGKMKGEKGANYHQNI